MDSVTTLDLAAVAVGHRSRIWFAKVETSKPIKNN